MTALYVDSDEKQIREAGPEDISRGVRRRQVIADIIEGGKCGCLGVRVLTTDNSEALALTFAFSS